MLIAAIALGGIGLLAAVGLGVAAKLFYVEVDPLVAALEEALPGANCGGCGFAGCSAAAEALAEGRMAPTTCVASSPEGRVQLAGLLGMEVAETEPRLARVGCRYSIARADLKFNYSGVVDCRAAVVLNGGPKECPIGCIGLGSCVRSCPFDALSMGEDNLPVVDESKCTGCGTCVRTCPQSIMELTSVTDRILGEFQTNTCTAPCQRTCPAGINIPQYIRQAARGDYEASLVTIMERNPLPLICGRICPHPCEHECRRNLVDEPVAINDIKRFVSDYERTSGHRVELFKAPATGRQVAIIGGGALGLTAAAFLARLGHEPAVFEASGKMGGLLRTAISENRLPREVLDYEIQGILKLGVKAECNQVFGRDFTISALLKAGFEAVLVAAGGWDSCLVQGGSPDPAQPIPGLYLLLPLLLSWRSGQKPALGKKVALVGGGRKGLEAAVKLKREGAERVLLLAARSQEEEGWTEEDLKEAREAGVEVVFQARPMRLEGQGESLTGLAVRLAGSGSVETVYSLDTVIAASGRLPEMIITSQPGGVPPELDSDPSWQVFRPYGRQGQGQLGLFESDRTVSDYRAVVEAIGTGRRAAASIHKYLASGEVASPERMLTPDFQVINVDSVDNLFPCGPRELPPQAGVEELAEDPGRELTPGLEMDQIRQEASRCLDCGLICYARTKYN